MAECVVEVWRGDVVESRHRVSVAVVDGDGVLRAHAGDPELLTFPRSSVKALQALPLVEDGAADAFGLNDTELAVACASHSGEEMHVAATRSLLGKAGLDAGALACGAVPPLSKPARRALQQRGEAPARVHNECSGKHAGMLALAAFHGWPTDGYERLEHPVQQRMLQEISRWTGVATDQIPTAVDGCAVTTFALPLSRIAFAFARFAAAARRAGGAEARLVGAMLRHPEYVAGTDRLCTILMQAAGGRVIVKVGAEGGYVAADLERGVGVALKAEDGAKRAGEPGILAVLEALGLLDGAARAAVGDFIQPSVTNTRGDAVGHVAVRLALQHA